MRIIGSVVSIGAAAVLLAGCGGGGGAPGGGITTPPPPTPPTPTPTPTPTPPPAMGVNSSFDGPLSSETFATLGSSGSANTDAARLTTTANSGPSTIQVVYDATMASYTISAGVRTQTFTAGVVSGGGHEVVFNRSTGGNTNRLTLTAAPAVYPPAALLRFVRRGLWERVDGAATSVDAFVYGMPTSSASVPITGAASFDTDVTAILTAPGLTQRTLLGAGTFDVDFAAGVFKLQSYVTEHDYIGGGWGTGAGFALHGAGRINGAGGFTGSIAYPSTYSASVNGTLDGRFYGPGAQEVGLTFTASNAGGAALTGAMTGRRGNDYVPPLSLINLPSYAYPTNGPRLTLLVTSEASTPTVVRRVEARMDTGRVAFYSEMTELSFTGWPAPTVQVRPANRSTVQRPNFVSYDVLADDGVPVHIDVYRPGPANTELALTYASFAAWTDRVTSFGELVARRAVFTYGIASDPVLVARRTGTARYDGIVHGYGIGDDAVMKTLGGTSRFNVDFSGQTYNGELVLTVTPEGGGTITPLGSWTFASTLSRGALTAAVLHKVGGAPGGPSSDIMPAFYGPEAEEIAAPFQIREPSVGANPTPSYVGAALAQRP